MKSTQNIRSNQAYATALFIQDSTKTEIFISRKWERFTISTLTPPHPAL